MSRVDRSIPDLSALTPALALADWRRRIAALYAGLRAMADPAAAHARWLEERGRLFSEHPMSPLPEAERAQFPGIAAFAYDPALRLHVRADAVEGPEITLDLGEDGTMRMAPAARTAGLAAALGGELTLYWIGGYGGGLFLPFRDATSGEESYGGGRYVIDAIKGADLGTDAHGRLILDFNFAYNPSCALNDRFLCPLPPPGNTLPAAVRGGERTP